MFARCFAGVLVLAAALAAAYVSTGTDSEPVRVSSVDVALSQGGPVVLLKAKDRVIPIFVDAVVARAIHSVLTSAPPPRPLTHDLMHTVLQAYDAKVTKVTITLKEEVYFAELTIQKEGKDLIFDSRSSDAIALAVRFGAPIFVGADLLDSAGKRLPGVEERAL